MKRYMSILTAALVMVGTAGVARAANNPCAAAIDTNNDGTADFNVAYVYSGSNLRTELTYPVDQSSPSQIIQYVYDRLGRVWGKAIDTNGDRFPEREIYYAYQSDGKLYAEGIDDGSDGILDQITEYTYSGNDRLSAVDLQADGTLDRVDRLTSFYDAQGRLIREIFDEGDDGIAKRNTSYVYGASGNLTGKFVDRDGNGTIDEVTRYAYQC